MDKVFCLLPYVHFQIWSSGDVFPCCFSANDYEQNKVGNIRDFSSIDDVANSPKQKDLRVRMRDGQPIPECSTCIRSEQVTGSSFRLDFKKSFDRYLDDEVEQVIDTMQPDGTLTNFKMKYMDVRFSTVCNQKCRTCGPHFSSSWAAETIKYKNDIWIAKVMKISNENKDIHQEILDKSDDIDVFYFAGGEPLVTPEHFDILEKTDLSDKTVVYNTNFSNLNWKNYNVIDIWKNIPRLTIHASIDASRDKYDYMRSGSSFQTIVDHFNKFHAEIDNSYQKISINLTVSALNVFYLPEIINDFRDYGFIKEDGLPLNISFVFNPLHFKATIFTKDQKKVIEDKLLAFAEADGNGRHMGQIHQVISFMNSADDSQYLDEFKAQVKDIDGIRHENFATTFPELSKLINYE